MKRTDLEKNKALKLMGQMQNAGVPGRFAQGATALLDRREQRKMDQAAGLVPFAVKLHQDLVRQLHERASQEGLGLHELTAQVIKAGLGMAAVASAPASVTKAVIAKEPSAKKAVVQKAVAEKVAAQKTATPKASASKVPTKKAAAKKVAAKAPK